MRIGRCIAAGGMFFPALFLLATITLAQSQASTGQIVGIVSDPTGAAVPGAKVTVVNKATGLNRELETNEVGQFRALLLPPGTYIVTVEKQGFNTAKEPDVAVTVGSSVDLNLKLQVGNVSQVVEVTASQIEVTTSQATATVNDNFITNLPINGRRFHDFVQITPTVQVEPSRNQLSFVGQRGINGNVNIDGADYNEPFFGGLRGGERSNNAFTIPQESIQEFQVVAQGYSAEFGRSTGGLVNAVTKSGTNDVHGSAFYLMRHKELGARNAFDQMAITNQFQEGGSAGGALRKDKTFFFGSMERQDINIPRQALFANLNSATRDATTAEAYDYYRSQEGPYTATNDATAFLVKIDNNFSTKHRLAARYNYSRNTGLNSTSRGQQIDPAVNSALSNNGTEGDRTHTLMGQLTSVFSANLLNEFRGQYSRESRPRDANAQMTTVESFVGNFGTVSFLPTTAVDYRIQFSDSIAWNHGGHSIRVGGEYNYLNIFQTFGFNQFGRFIFSGSGVNTSNTVLQLMSVYAGHNRFDDTRVKYLRQIGNLTLGAASQALAFFAQDSWRVNRNFTVNYGLRWEGAYNPQPEANNTTIISKVQNYKFPVGIAFDPNRIPNNLTQWMPRLGAAWDPKGDGRTVLRANAGIFYAQTPLLTYAAPLNNFRVPAGDLSIQLPLSVPTGNPFNTVYKQLLAIGIDLNKFTLGQLPVLTPQQVQSVAAAIGLSGVDPFFGAQPIGMGNDFENPRSFQWAAGVEHEIRDGLTVGADFYDVNTVHLERNHELNLNAPTLRAADGRMVYNIPSFVRPISTLGSIQIRESSARSLYRALVFRVGYNRPKLQLKAFYTLSWSYSDDDNERDAGGSSATDQFNLKQDYGYSKLDRRHQFSLFTTYLAPHGFEISSITRLLSGLALDATAGSDMNGDLISNDRPYSAPGVVFPRNAFRNRAQYNVDIRVAKNIRLHSDRFSLQLSADLFNIFDFANVTYNTTTYGPGISATGTPVAVDSRFQRMLMPDGTYDKTNTPGSPFQTQLGIRLIF